MLDFPSSPSAGQIFQSFTYSNQWKRGSGTCMVRRAGNFNSVSNVDIELPAAYRFFQLLLKGLEPAGAAAAPVIRVSYDNGATFVADPNTYRYMGHYTAVGVSGNFGSFVHAFTTGIVPVHTSVNTVTGLAFYDFAIDPGDTGYQATFNWSACYVAGGLVNAEGAGQAAASGRITHIRLFFGAGTFHLRQFELIGFTGYEAAAALGLPILRFNAVQNTQLFPLIDDI